MHKRPQISRSQTHTRPLLSCTLTLPLIFALLSSAANAQIARTPAQAEDEALALYGQALQLEGAGQDEAARPRVMRALEIAERELGLKHPGVPILLQNIVELGKRFDDRADYAAAELLYLRALDLTEKLRGPQTTETATLTNLLGNLYLNKGDYPHAEQFLARTLSIREHALAPTDPLISITLNNLGGLYGQLHDYERAEQFYQRAMTISVQARGADNPDVPTFLNNLGTIYQARGQHAEALRLFARALALTEKFSGADSPDVALQLNNAADSHIALGEYAQARALLQRALTINERQLGAQHPYVATVLNNLSALAVLQGNTSDALISLGRAAEIREHNIALVIGVGSDAERQRYMATLADETSFIIWLHLNRTHANDRAARLALTTLLRRKGRVLDVLSDEQARLRRRLAPADQTLLAQLSATRARLATLTFKPPGGAGAAVVQAETTRLVSASEQLEAQLSARSTEFRTTAAPVTLAAVQAALPADAALIEFAFYQPFNPATTSKSDKYGAPHYAAYVLRRTGQPQAIELGAAADIDRLITRWRGTLADPRRADVRQLARALDESLMRPVRRLTGSAQQLLVAPDSTLNLIPFGALVDEQN
ncbi:MAG TPA: tetratricopeptide repeat protein, partial [Pyrinomonadaceae bacterium]|nr:tetratricopeptide repeat protein [Pyrinomonadaceae bacterium]